MKAIKRRLIHKLPIFKANEEPIQAPNIMLRDRGMAILKMTKSFLMNTTVARPLQIRPMKLELPLACKNVEPMKKMNTAIMNGPMPPKNPP